jgi:pro-kumamolisin-like protein
MEHRNYLRFANKASVLTCLLAFTAFMAGSSRVRAQSSTAAQDNPSSASFGALTTVPGHTVPQVLDGRATRVSHYNPQQKLRLALAVKPPHMAEEEKFLKDLTTKGSPNFHKFLSADDWNARFAPAVEDEQKVVDWAKSQGLTVTNRFANRLLVDVEAPAGVIEKAFGVTLNNYQYGEEVDFANDRDPVLPSGVAEVVTSVMGLNSIQRFHRLSSGSRIQKGPDYAPGPALAQAAPMHGDGDLTKAPANRAASMASMSTPAPRNGPALDNGVADPANITSSEAYDFDGLHAISHCCNPHNYSTGSPAVSSIALVTYGDFNYSDVTTFFQHYGFAWDINSYYVNGSGYPGQDDEAPLDVEYSTAMANSYGSYLDTAHVYVYEAPNGLYATYADVYNAIASNNYAKVVSTSYGWEEGVGFSNTQANNVMHGIFNTMVGQGWTLIAAAGDNGASDGCGDALAVDYPASDPDFVAAGGTQLSLNASGNFVSETAWVGETWSGACASNHGGGGGGVSKNFAAPYWQSPLGYTMRAMPDISLTANPDVMGEWYFYNGQWWDEGGTSIVAPELAGFFAQENSYLDYIGNRCGSTGTSACTPVGNPDPYIYFNGIDGAPHNPFYDITSGCNSNDITAYYGLGSYCAHAGFDLATGWGSANMMQLAWGINWELIPAYGNPSIAFSGPATNTWYNTNQTVSWNVSDAGSGSFPAPGVAGFTQGWDSIPADPQSQPHGGSGNSFYSGPQFPFATGGCLAFQANGCAGGVVQGCHTAKVEGWDNQGRTAFGSYGPVCFDTVAPVITISNNPATSATVWANKAVVVSLAASDPGGAGASGIYRTYYAIDSGLCYPGSVSTCGIYTGPFTISAQGRHYVYYFTEDKAGNYSTETYEWVSIDTAPPVTTVALAGTLQAGSYYSNVQVTLTSTDNLSGVRTRYYQLDGGATQTYTAAFTVSATGSHTVKYWSVDNAGNTEATKSVTFTIAAGRQASMISPTLDSTFTSSSVAFKWTTGTAATGYQLYVGTTPGAHNLYASGVTTATSVTVTGLPTNGSKIYVQLITYFPSTLLYTSYVYTAQ